MMTDLVKNKNSLLVYSEQVKQLYESFITTIAATIGMAVLLVITQWTFVETSLLLGWLLAVIAVTLLRVSLYYFYKQKKTAVELSQYWGRLFFYSTALSGVVWGMAAILFLQGNEIEHQVVILLVLNGMAAGAVTTLSVIRKVAYVYILPVMLPLIPMFLMSDNELSIILSIMIFLSLTFLIHSSNINFKNMRENIDLRLAATEREKSLIKAKELAEKSSAAKSEFLSSMSHELRTPMNAILGFTQLLDYDNELNEEQQDSVNEVLNAGNHLLNLINEVLDLSRIESGNIELLLEQFELAAVVEESYSLITPMAQLQGVSIHYGSLTGHSIYADRVRLKQVLINLLTNAIKYNCRLGKVDLEVKVTKLNKIRITITDTGRGISDDRLEEIFQPFNRLETRDNNIEGTGIGLSITRNLVELMSGTIGVNSREGIGSCFWLEFPMEMSTTMRINNINKVAHEG